MIANVTSGLFRIRNLLTWISFPSKCLVRLYNDDKTTIYIVENPVFHERTNHIKADCDILRKKLEENIMTKHVLTCHQLVDILTKPLGRTQISFVKSWAWLIFMLQLGGEC